MALDQKTILKAAFKLLDAEGLEGLTMRRLAQAMDIQAPSLYWHFENRRALLDAMADALLDPVARDIPPDAPWESAVRQIAHEVRAAFKSRRDGARLFAGTYPVSENVLRAGDAMIGAIRRSGLSPTMAGWATFSLIYYVIGFVIEEESVGPSESTGKVALPALKDRAQQFLTDEHEHPTVLEALPAILDEDFDRRFEFGLDLFIRGLRSRLSETAAK
jgi:AcrR family transcriptional regulator